MQSFASDAWRSSIATNLAATLWSISSDTAVTATAKWTIRPLRSRLLYKAIKDHPPLWEIYAEDAEIEDAKSRADAIKAEIEAAQKRAGQIRKKPMMRALPNYWDKYQGKRYKPEYEVETAVSAEELQSLTNRLTTFPADFHIHPKVGKLLEQRAEMGNGKRAVDYGMAEALAFASLVKAGTPVRLSGQDSRRGTFNQRHSVLIDIENEQEHVPLQHVSNDQAACAIYNSTLSEAGVLGFEYGYSRDYPETLVLWEAQFGDFRQCGAGDHRPIHRSRRIQVGPAVRVGAAAAARIRRPGPGALKRAHRALSAIGCR